MLATNRFAHIIHSTLLVCLVMILMPAPAARAQAVAALDVHVTDQSRGPIPRARIMVTDRRGGPARVAASDLGGRTRFAALARGDYLVEVTARGFASSGAREVRLATAGSHEVTIVLTMAGLVDTVVVTASGTARSTGELTRIADVVTLADMDQRATRTIAEAVQGVAGVRAQQIGGPGASASLHVRGMRGEDTALLIDGVAFRDPGATQGDAGPFVSDLLVVNPDRVEVLRGSGSALYGSHAIGGAINIVTRPGTGPPAGELAVEAGGLGTTYVRARVGGGLLGDRIGYSLGLTRLEVTGGVDGDDRADNTSAQGDISVVLATQARLSARYFGGEASTMINEAPAATASLPPAGIVEARPAPGADTTFIAAADDPDNRRGSSFRSTLILLQHQPNSRLGYRVFAHDLSTTRRFDDGPLGTSGFEPAVRAQTAFDGRIMTVGARADVDAGRHLLTAGYESERERYASEATATPDAPASVTHVVQRSHTAFIQDQIAVTTSLLASAAIRLQSFSVRQPRFTPPEGSPYQGVAFAAPPGALTVDVSAAYTLDEAGTRVKAHAGTGYRAPSLFERFGASLGRGGYSTYGDPRLGPERALTLDVGVEHVVGRRARISATVFRTGLEEAIVFDFSRAIDPTTDPFGRSAGYRMAEGASSRGVELGFAGTVGGTARFDAAYTFVDAEPRTAGPVELTQAEAMPRHQGAIAVSRPFGPHLHASVTLLITSAHFALLADPVTFDARVFRFGGARRADAVITYTRPLGGRTEIRLFGRIDNLLGDDYYESGFRTPGRQTSAGIGARF